MQPTLTPLPIAPNTARPYVDATGWAKLMRALGLASPVKFT